MDPAPIEHCCRCNGIRDLSPIVCQRIDECVRQFPLTLNFLGHCRGPSLDCRVDSFHSICSLYGSFRFPSNFLPQAHAVFQCIPDKVQGRFRLSCATSVGCHNGGVSCPAHHPHDHDSSAACAPCGAGVA